MTLLFQPVIYDNASSTNGIGFFRNTSTSYKADAESGHEYTPDYLIKIKCPKFTKYIIPDAKFSAPDNIKRSRLQEPVYKYLFSISPSDKNDKIDGMYR